ncbi:unnamed protein product, partial [Ectocarpus sp. 12 AP-2014]
QLRNAQQGQVLYHDSRASLSLSTRLGPLELWRRYPLEATCTCARNVLEKSAWGVPLKFISTRRTTPSKRKRRRTRRRTRRCS